MTGKEKLRRLADNIKALADQERELQQKQGGWDTSLPQRPAFPPTIPYELSDWFVEAVAEYLDGDHVTLNQALGLASDADKRPRARSPKHEADVLVNLYPDETIKKIIAATGQSCTISTQDLRGKLNLRAINWVINHRKDESLSERPKKNVPWSDYLEEIGSIFEKMTSTEPKPDSRNYFNFVTAVLKPLGCEITQGALKDHLRNKQPQRKQKRILYAGQETRKKKNA